MNLAGCSGQQGRCEAGSPQIAAGKDVQERHQRDQGEDPPCQLPAPSQVRPVGGQVEPHQHNGDGMQKTSREDSRSFFIVQIYSGSREAARPGHPRSSSRRPGARHISCQDRGLEEHRAASERDMIRGAGPR